LALRFWLECSGRSEPGWNRRKRAMNRSKRKTNGAPWGAPFLLCDCVLRILPIESDEEEKSRNEFAENRA